MKISLEQLIAATENMNPVQFEAYCNSNEIQIDWWHVTLNDYNDGTYHVTLPQYNDANVFANDGSAVKIANY